MIIRNGAPTFVVGLIGPPCCGVTTLARALHALHTSVAVVGTSTDLGQVVAGLTDRGVEWIVLDGVPPTVESLEELIGARVLWPHSALVYVQTDDDVCCRRGAGKLAVANAAKQHTAVLEAARRRYIPTFSVGASEGPDGLRLSIQALARLLGYPG